jgi:hypothetical protein
MREQFIKLIKSFVWLGIVLLIIRCFFSRESLINNFSLYDVFGYIVESVGLSVILITFYERFLWRYNPFEATPVLKKRYKGVLRSTYDGLDLEATLEIHQTLLTISIVLHTGESKSKSITASIEIILGEKQLTYCYLNTPNASVRNRSDIHYGTAMLCVDDVNKLKGQYFSDRKTTGDIEFTPDEVNSKKNRF